MSSEKKLLAIIKKMAEALHTAERMADMLNAYEHEVDELLKEISKAKKAGNKIIQEFKDRPKVNKKVKTSTKHKKAVPDFMKPVIASPALAEIIGNKPMPRTQIVSKLWDYIRKNKLQDPENRRIIIVNDALLPISGGKKKISMFDLAKMLSKNIKKANSNGNNSRRKY